MSRAIASPCLLLAFVLSFASPAAAGSLASAVWTVELGYLGTTFSAIVPVTALGSSTATSISVGVGVPQTSWTQVVTTRVGTTRTAGLIGGVSLGGSANLVANAGGAAATRAIAGKFSVRTFSQPPGFPLSPGFKVVSLPLRFGASGTQMGTWKFTGQNHNLTIQFLPWAPYSRTFTGLTAMGQALPTVMVPGSFALTALGGGTMTLNAPILIRQTGAIIRNQTVGFSKLTLTFVPEPSAGLLVVAAAGALALFARRR